MVEILPVPAEWTAQFAEARSLLVRFLVRHAMATWAQGQLKKVA